MKHERLWFGEPIYGWSNVSGGGPASVLHEEVKDPKPVLYDHRGKPLTYPKRSVGFVPPKDRKP